MAIGRDSAVAHGVSFFVVLHGIGVDRSGTSFDPVGWLGKRGGLPGGPITSRCARSHAAAQRVTGGMSIARMLHSCSRKLRNLRSASREAAARKAEARDLAQKQVLMQHLAETLMAGRTRGRK
jgi:hypothetical protein